MQNTPKGMRLHIGLFGKRNAGKSSLLNLMTRQETSIVSPTPGTTTDPVEKAMELLPIGPVLFIDTAGFDDAGELGNLRVEKTRKIMERTDLALVLCDAGAWSQNEADFTRELKKKNRPVIVVITKIDLSPPDANLLSELQKADLPYVAVSVNDPESSRHRLRKAIIENMPEEYLQSPVIAGDLVQPGEIAMLVVPIDLEAPKGRLILPQVQTLRDLLDHDACAMVVKERELREALDCLKQPPSLVITDSQAFLKVAADTPPDVKMTSFSILFARIKGDLLTFAQGAQAIDQLVVNDRILIAEACSHHAIGDDIGRIKIPRWLRQYVGGALEIDHVQGQDFPTDVSDYRLVIHCGSCTFNRRLLLSRMEQCRSVGVPITNYGIAIAKSLGILHRALSPFPDILEALVT